MLPVMVMITVGLVLNLSNDAVGPGGKVAVIDWQTTYWLSNYLMSVFKSYLEKSDLVLLKWAEAVTYDDMLAAASAIISQYPEVQGLFADNTGGPAMVAACRDAERKDIKIVVDNYDEATLLNLVDGSITAIYADATYLAQFSSFSLRCLVPSLRQISPQLEDSYLLHHPGWFGRQKNIVWPLAQTGIKVAWILVFVLSLGELGSTVLVIPAGMETLSLRISNLMHYGAYDLVAALSAILLGFALMPLTLLFWKRAEKTSS